MDPNNNLAQDIDKEQLKKDKKKAKEEAKAAKIAKAKEKAQKQEQQKKEKEENTDKSADKSDKSEKKKAKKKTEDVQEEPFVDTTPPGEKKDMSQPMRLGYEPKAVEAAWYEWWVKKGFFYADNKSTKEKFVIVIPPPNVTGYLHLGHALTASIEDSVSRWHRMQGKTVLWVPGTDHAGIATQVVVEKKLQRERNLTRHDLGREAFIQEVWKWKNQYGGRISNQSKKLAISVDWSREVFTMDEKLSRAVKEAFVRFYEQGLIYRANRLVNWCCKLNTAISDIEVEYVPIEKRTKRKVPGHGDKEYEFGVLTDFAYKVEGSDEEVVISTTRPETMLGDTAVAVHPDDNRYKHLHGKFLIHPFVNRKIPIITDSTLVDMNFGTGAVKITPGHDPNDYACGQRNNLPIVNILNDDGTLNENAAQFKGMKRFDAREAVIDQLKAKGLYRGTRDNPMVIGICSRSKDIIEPIIKPQWYVNCKEMAAASVAAVKEGRLQIIPEEHKATWYRWLENIHDWCISRQLWWGHRIPAYLISIEGQADDWTDSDKFVVARTEEEAHKVACAKFPNAPASKITLKQDPDVLDTWFSSGIFPFSVMGWPDDTDDMKAFYPTSLLETGRDILFFWVARMVMMGLQLTGKLPFSQVYLHSIVRDAHGRKMSKSLGNVIDPTDMINGISLEGLHKQLYEGNLDPSEIKRAEMGQKEDFPGGIPECGTDALRFALCAYTSQGGDINLDVKRVAAYRAFCNKLWNATKFSLMHLGSDFKPADEEMKVQPTNPNERWILSRLSTAVRLANEGFKAYDFSQVTSALYSFWLYDLCDVYLESMKPIMQSNDEGRKQSARETLYTCLDQGLRLLHPFMPFVTEELWQRLPRRASQTWESICIAAYPQLNASLVDDKVEAEMKFVQEIIHSIRSLRSNFGLTKERPTVYVNLHSEELFKPLKENYPETLTFLSQSSEVIPLLNTSTPPEGCAVEIVDENCEVYMLIKGLVDIKVEIEKLQKKVEKTTDDLNKIIKLTEGPHYHKTPEKVRLDNNAKMDALRAEIANINKAIESFTKFL